MSANPVSDADRPSNTSEPTLKRVMGPRLIPLFIVGDVLGTRGLCLTGQVAEQVGGAVRLSRWLS